jgi:hypothetical protein
VFDALETKDINRQGGRQWASDRLIWAGLGWDDVEYPENRSIKRGSGSLRYLDTI